MATEPFPQLDPAIADYYVRAPEESRLEHGAFPSASTISRPRTFIAPTSLPGSSSTRAWRCRGIYGIEGPGWLFPDIAERMQDDRRRTEVVHVARLLESEPSVLGASAHIMAVAARG